MTRSLDDFLDTQRYVFDTNTLWTPVAKSGCEGNGSTIMFKSTAFCYCCVFLAQWTGRACRIDKTHA